MSGSKQDQREQPDLRVLHHFLCAYVGPASDFFDGDLWLCPKCGRPLVEEGSDWDVIRLMDPSELGA